MQLHEILKQTMDFHGIRGKDLAAVINISQNHLSEIRSGRKWVSADTFLTLLEGLDTLRPGSRLYFCQLLAQKPFEMGQVKSELVSLIELASDEEIEAAILAIGKKWKESRRESSKLTIVESDDVKAMPLATIEDGIAV
jgi:transcriptional regulator with XRE-family HTH domain